MMCIPAPFLRLICRLEPLLLRNSFWNRLSASYIPSGHQPEKVLYRIRYVALALIAAGVFMCTTILFLMGSKSLHQPNSLCYLFRGVLIEIVVTELTEISILGLLKPLRYGTIYPRQEKCQWRRRGRRISLSEIKWSFSLRRGDEWYITHMIAHACLKS